MPGKHNAGGCGCCGCWDCTVEPTGITVSTTGTGVGGDDCCEFPVGTFMRSLSDCFETWLSSTNIWGVTAGIDIDTGCYEDLCYGVPQFLGTDRPDIIAACSAVSKNGCGWYIMAIVAIADGDNNRPFTDTAHQFGWKIVLSLSIPRTITVTIEKVYVISEPPRGDTTTDPCQRNNAVPFAGGGTPPMVGWGYTIDSYEYEMTDCDDRPSTISQSNRVSYWIDLLSDTEGDDDTIIIDDGVHTFSFDMCAAIGSVGILWP